jgi:hypothetical protein
MGPANGPVTPAAGEVPRSVPVPERAELLRIAPTLGLERNTTAVVGAMFLMALGENLWRRFIPKYLEAIGAYGSTEDLLDGLYQVSRRLGRRSLRPP